MIFLASLLLQNQIGSKLIWNATKVWPWPCCTRMQVWCRWDQNCVRIDSKEWARTKRRSSPDKEKPNSCWVFPGFSPGKRTNSCFGKVFYCLLKEIENISKSDMIKVWQFLASNLMIMMPLLLLMMRIMKYGSTKSDWEMSGDGGEA